MLYVVNLCPYVFFSFTLPAVTSLLATQIAVFAPLQLIPELGTWVQLDTLQLGMQLYKRSRTNRG